MDRFTFISSLVSSVGWPVAAVALALLFRRSLIARIPSLTKFKAGSFEAEFAESAPILQASEGEARPSDTDPADRGTDENHTKTDPDAGGKPGPVEVVDRLNEVQRELIESA